MMAIGLRFTNNYDDVVVNNIIIILVSFDAN